MGYQKELLHDYYRQFAATGRITEHNVKEAVKHAGGEHISDHHAGHLLRSLEGWDGVVSEHEFVHGVHRYIENHRDQFNWY